MGNEMGNNNVSGLREDEKARSEEAQGKLSKQEISANELNGENHKEPEAEEKKLHEKQDFDEKEDTVAKGEDNTSPPGEGKDFNEVVFCSETLLVAAGTQVENETSDEKDENDIESKPLSRALEIPAESNDAPHIGVGVQKFTASDISDLYARGAENHDKTNWDENLITENEHHIKKEITIGRENNETDGPTIDSNAGSHDLDPDSDQHEVHSEEAGCGSNISQEESEESVGLSALAQSENNNLVINGMAEKMHICVIPEAGDNLLVKANVSEEETCQRTSDEASVCDGDESKSPLDALQSPPVALTSAEEASELEASKSPVEASEMPFLQAMNSPVETLEQPQEASKSPEALEVPLVKATNSPMQTLEPPLEASESPVQVSNLQLEALTSLESSGPPLEAFKSALETFKSPMEDSDSPIEAPDPPVQAVMSLPKASNSPLEASELAVEASKSQTEALQPPVETSKSPPETSELPWEALDSLLESQPEAFLQSTSVNSCQEFYEPQDKIIDVPIEAKLIAREMENKETQLDSNQAQPSGQNDKYSASSESNASRSQSISVDSNCNINERENASNSSIVEDFLASEPALHINEPQVAVVYQTFTCFEEQTKMEKSMLLTEETKSVGSEVESKDNKSNHSKTELAGKDIKDLKVDDFISSQSEVMTSETDVQKNGEQSALKFSSIYSTGECQLENLEENINELDVSFVDKNLEKIQEPYKVNANRLSELKAVPTESTGTESTHEEDMTREEIDDNYKQSISLENNREKGDIIGQYSNQQAQDLRTHFSDSEAAEDKNEVISGSSGFSVIAENFGGSLSIATEQSLVVTHEEHKQNIQATSKMAGETEARPLMFDDKSDKTPETVEKLMTESSSESNHVEFRKSPSFHFDLSIGSRSEESDQTPLLSHDMITGRGLSSGDNTVSQKDTAQTDYSSPEDEAMLVVEKTIRMERSDSERPSTPFLSLIQKEEIAEASVTPGKQQENFGADTKRKDTWTVIHKTFALTSPRDSSGKRKSMSSFFSTCICCAAKIP